MLDAPCFHPVQGTLFLVCFENNMVALGNSPKFLAKAGQRLPFANIPVVVFVFLKLVL
jgi:hypothetical protein